MTGETPSAPGTNRELATTLSTLSAALITIQKHMKKMEKDRTFQTNLVAAEKKKSREKNLSSKKKWLAISKMAKTTFGLGLFMFFVLMFGQPALEKYQAESVITLETEIHHGFNYPSVTVCPSSDGSKWKKGEISMFRAEMMIF